MARTVQLRDGSVVQLRPLTREDTERSLEFFRALPDEDLAYLRGDPTRPAVLERRMQEMESGEADRLIALVDDTIVAEGSLEMTGRNWTAHVGELRLIVASDYQRKGLGMIIAHELYALAARSKLELVMVALMRPQTGAQRMFQKLGFHEDAVLPRHVCDRKGKYQDLVIMRCDLKALWKELEGFFSGSSGPRTG